ncbi:MAG: glutathione S-transferase [Pseudomonadota bacterium]
MITVHHLEDSRSQRVLWLLEELGVDYEIIRYERNPETKLAPDALKKIHPLGKSPVITDGEITVAETGAIVEYLIDAYGSSALSVPSDPAVKREYTYWLHFAEGTAMPQLLLKLFFGQVQEAPMPFFAKPIAKAISGKVLSSYIDPNLSSQLSFIDAHLAKNAWFAGDTMTGADIMMIFPLEAAASRSGARSFKSIGEYLDKIHARPAYKAALEKGGPYAYAAAA